MNYSSEENKELIENLKGPRFYRIMLSGYGGESAYMSISEDAYNFWQNHTEEYGDSDLVTYMVESENGDAEYEDIEGVPTEAEFLTDEEGDARPWYESHTEFEHTYGVAYDSAYITVEEVESADYNANVIRDVISGEDLSSLLNSLETEDELVHFDSCGETDAKYIAQMYSSEKGVFFSGVIETHGSFDLKKLKVYATEFLNGEDTVTSIEYDGVDIDNEGGDTNGKGYSAAVWEA